MKIFLQSVITVLKCTKGVECSYFFFEDHYAQCCHHFFCSHYSIQVLRILCIIYISLYSPRRVAEKVNKNHRIIRVQVTSNIKKTTLANKVYELN
jgi:hypothetical protein